APRGAAALRPGIGALGPGLRTRLAGSRNRVPPPQLLPGIGIPAVQEPARGGFAARDPRNQHAIRTYGSAGRVVAVIVFGVFLVPNLLARFHVERDQMIVDC